MASLKDMTVTEEVEKKAVHGSFVMRNRIHKGLFEGEKMKAKSGCRREQ